VFAEVKAKSGTRYGDPLEMVTEEKVRRLMEAAELWLAFHPDCAGLDIRFEVVGIAPSGLRRVTLA
jgi:putative endonuclease